MVGDKLKKRFPVSKNSPEKNSLRYVKATMMVVMMNTD